MRIIVAGAGEVGRHVSKMLSNDRHDIILLDDESKLQDLDSSLDIMTVSGSPTSLSDLHSCGIQDADMFIAVTPHECVNMTACMLAKNLGAKKTISRIDNYEYLQPKNKEFFRNMGVDTLIYPEMLAASEIVQTLQLSWIREYHTFCNDALVVVCVKVRSNAAILNKEFKTGYFNHDKFRVVALKRNNKTIIPTGEDMLLANDLVYFICSKQNIEVVKRAAGKISYEISNLLIMGGSRIAVKTAQYLPDNFNVKIIESDMARCHELADKIDTLIIHGDGRNLELLKDEGIEDADAFIAITGNSEANVLACLAAKRFGINRTIAEIENMDYIDLAENLDIGTIINKKLLAASFIYQQTLDDDALNLQCLTYSDAEIIEFIVEPGDKITKARVRDLNLPEDVNIGGVIRDGKGYIINGNSVILPKDHVVIFTMAQGVRKLAKLFNN